MYFCLCFICSSFFQKMSNSKKGSKFTSSEISTLLKLREEGKSFADIATIIKRDASSVKYQYTKQTKHSKVNKQSDNLESSSNVT